jgi:hypothetical protein
MTCSCNLCFSRKISPWEFFRTKIKLRNFAILQASSKFNMQDQNLEFEAGFLTLRNFAPSTLHYTYVCIIKLVKLLPGFEF